MVNEKAATQPQQAHMGMWQMLTCCASRAEKPSWAGPQVSAATPRENPAAWAEIAARSIEVPGNQSNETNVQPSEQGNCDEHPELVASNHAFKRLPSVGTWLKVDDGKQNFTTLFTAIHDPAGQHQQAPVPTADVRSWLLRPSVGTWLGVARKPVDVEATAQAKAKAPNWQQRPSVGTWVGTRGAEAGAEPSATWPLRPSVGTWVQGTPATGKVLLEECEDKAAKHIDSVPAWQLRPSVGTWVSATLRNDIDDVNERNANVDRAPASWVTRPSVGTWVGMPCSPDSKYDAEANV